MAGLRVLRGGLLALMTVLLALSAHLIGGGTVPPSAPVLLAGLMIGAAAVAWSGRRHGFAALAAAAAAAQLGFHLTLELTPQQHVHHGGSAQLWGGLDPRMLLAHAAGTVVLAAVLVRGDTALDALRRAGGRLLGRRPVAPPADRPLPQLLRVARIVPTVAHQVVVLRPRRGPPAPARA